MNIDKLLLSEAFFSVQCEGISTGFPAFFARLSTCNLTCGATPRFVNQFKKDLVNYDPGTFKGDLHEQNKAAWTCDSIPVWAKGVEREFSYLTDLWKTEGIYKDVSSGLIHIIWTGGEPTTPMHQKAIWNFNKWWYLNEDDLTITPFQEIETNGTFYIEDNLFEILNQINCSAKLSNSGMTEKQRIVPKAIKRIMDHKKYQFKFVISNEEDVKEIFATYIEPFEIPLKNVVCMPGLDSREDFHERTKFVLEMAKKYKFVGLTRLHISAWDRACGV